MASETAREVEMPLDYGVTSLVDELRFLAADQRPDDMGVTLGLARRLAAALTAERERAEREAGVVAQAHALIDAAGFGAGTLPARVQVLLSEVTLERERKEQAEREREEAVGIAQECVTLGTQQAEEYDRFWSALGVCDEAITVDDAVAVAHALVAERDTLRQHNAVLRAECQAGRAVREAVRDGYTGDWQTYDAAIDATDAAGAMGEASDGE